MKEEIFYVKKKYKKVYLDSIHIAEGPISFFALELLGKIFALIKENFVLETKTEVSIEAAPENCTDAFLKILKNIGINRISIKVDTFSNLNLKLLDKKYDNLLLKKSILTSYNYINNISVELLYGIPGSSQKDWFKDLKIASELPLNHISINEFVYRKNQRSSYSYQTKLFYNKTNTFLKRENFQSYETFSYAKKGFASKYYLDVFHMKNIIGMGPSSHGRIVENNQVFITQNNNCFKGWLKLKLHDRKDKRLTKKKILEEFLIQTLKTNIGINFSLLEKQFQMSVDKYMDFNRLKFLIKKGLLKEKDNRYFLSDNSRVVQNSIITDILY